MTGDQALLAVELAIMRVRDRTKRRIPHNIDVIEAFDDLAREIASIAGGTPQVPNGHRGGEA